jgi:nucleotide-binding universal stress UspA family protein
MFRLALVPVDGSTPALAAVDPAVRAVAPDGAILLLAVIPTVEELLTGIAAASQDARQAFELAEHSHAARREEAAQHLEAAAGRGRGGGWARGRPGGREW